MNPKRGGGDTPIRNVIEKEDHKVTSHQLLMAVRRKHKSIDTEKKSNVPEKQIAKENFLVIKYPDRMARTPTQEHLKKKYFFLLKKNRSQNEESEVTNHADSMASRRKKDHDKSEEGGTVINKSRSQTKSF